MLDTPQTSPESPANAGEWLSVAVAAARLGISTKTLRKRMASGAINSRRVVLARGGAAFEVEMESGLEVEVEVDLERSKPLSKPNTAQDVFTLETGGLEVEMESSKPTSKPMLKSSKPTSISSEREEELRAEVHFLRGLVEGHQRAEAELRAALREALKIAPRQLTAGGSSTTDTSARIASQRAQNGEVGNYGPGTPNGAQSGAKREETGADEWAAAYARIADELEIMNR